LRRFQRVNGLAETGNYDAATQRALMQRILERQTDRDGGDGVPRVTTYSRGDNNEAVRALQVSLNQLGYTVSEIGAGSVGEETLFFGPATERALRRFQRENGLAENGVYDARTQNAIARLLSPGSDVDGDGGVEGGLPIGDDGLPVLPDIEGEGEAPGVVQQTSEMLMAEIQRLQKLLKRLLVQVREAMKGSSVQNPFTEFETNQEIRPTGAPSVDFDGRRSAPQGQQGGGVQGGGVQGGGVQGAAPVSVPRGPGFNFNALQQVQQPAGVDSTIPTLVPRTSGVEGGEDEAVEEEAAGEEAVEEEAAEEEAEQTEQAPRRRGSSRGPGFNFNLPQSEAAPENSLQAPGF